MKLSEMSNADLVRIIEQLERRSAHHINAHKRWEAQQKLILAKRELHNRKPIQRILKRVKRFLG